MSTHVRSSIIFFVQARNFVSLQANHTHRRQWATEVCKPIHDVDGIFAECIRGMQMEAAEQYYKACTNAACG